MHGHMDLHMRSDHIDRSSLLTRHVRQTVSYEIHDFSKKLMVRSRFCLHTRTKCLNLQQSPTEETRSGWDVPGRTSGRLALSTPKDPEVGTLNEPCISMQYTIIELHQHRFTIQIGCWRSRQKQSVLSIYMAANWFVSGHHTFRALCHG